jgi:phospholipid transport system transporter-binding protein
MDSTYFKPSDELTFDTVVTNRADFYAQLLKDNSGKICLDLEKVVHCDSAGLAFLVEAKKLCKKHNKNLQLMGMASKTKSLAEFCGLEVVLWGSQSC